MTVPVFPNLKHFLLVIGSGRSGSTLIGAILDAHPRAKIANETTASTIFWRDLSGEAILREISENADLRRQRGRLSEGYDYSIERLAPQAESDVAIAGDKVWNPATLLLHGDARLLDRLETVLGVPVKMIHAIRNPFDVIATMHARSGASLADRARWYFMFSEAVAALHARVDPSRFIDCWHEELLEDPAKEIERLTTFLKLDCPRSYVDAAARRMFREPKTTRTNVEWDAGIEQRIRQRMLEFPFLRRYIETETLEHRRER
jgi:hypothetical protein